LSKVGLGQAVARSGPGGAAGRAVLLSAIWMKTQVLNTVCILNLLCNTFANFDANLIGVGERDGEIVLYDGR